MLVRTATLTAICAVVLLASGCASDRGKTGDSLSEFGQSASDGMKRLGGEITDGVGSAYDKTTHSEFSQSTAEGIKRLGGEITDGVETIIDKVKN